MENYLILNFSVKLQSSKQCGTGVYTDIQNNRVVENPETDSYVTHSTNFQHTCQDNSMGKGQLPQSSTGELSGIIFMFYNSIVVWLYSFIHLSNV